MGPGRHGAGTRAAPGHETALRWALAGGMLVAGAVAADHATAACLDDVAQIEQKLGSGQMSAATGAPAGATGAGPAAAPGGSAAVEMRMSSGETRTVADAPAAPTSNRELMAGLEAARSAARTGDESGCQEQLRSLNLKMKAGLVEGAGPAPTNRSESAVQSGSGSR